MSYPHNYVDLSCKLGEYKFPPHYFVVDGENWAICRINGLAYWRVLHDRVIKTGEERFAATVLFSSPELPLTISIDHPNAGFASVLVTDITGYFITQLHAIQSYIIIRENGLKFRTNRDLERLHGLVNIDF